MKPFTRSILNLCCAALAAFTISAAPRALAQTTNRAPSRPDFSSFKLITDRNIFDPRRRPSRSYSPRENRGPSRRVEYVTLTGTMAYDEKGPLAFFEGTSSDYRKVLKPSAMIAGYKIVEVSPSSVKLAVGTNEFELPVGMQLRREDQGNWHLAEPAYTSYESRSDSSRYSSRPPMFNPAGQTNTTVASADGEMAGDTNNPPMFDPSGGEPGDNGGPPPPPDAGAPGGGGGETDSVLARLARQRAAQEK